MEELNTQWSIGFVSGVLATLVGFIFTMMWDTYKYKRDIKHRDDVTLNIITSEIYENRVISAEIHSLVEQEIELLAQKKQLATTLPLLKCGYWDILKANRPKQLDNVPALLNKIMETSLEAARINDEIKSRQSYKIANQTITNYNETVELHDKILSSITKQYNVIADEILAELQST